MADKRISELEAITGANTAADDFFLVVDTSGAVTKKISRAELNNAIEQDVLSVVDINGGTIDGTVIGGSSAAAGTFTTFTSTGIDDNAASTAITINSSQNVGIGTTPSYRLHISNGSSTGTAMQLQTTGSGHNFDMVDGTGTARFRNVNGEMRLYGDLNSGGNGNIVFAPQGTTERLRLTSSGFLGLGTSSPTRLLHVEGAGSTTGSDDPSILISSTGTASSDDTIFRMQIGGTSAANYIFFGDSGDTNVGQIRYDHGSDYMSFDVNASEAMRIDSLGRLGLGVSAPASKAHIVGSSNDTVSQANANLNIEGAGGNGIVVGTIASSPYTSYLQSGFVDNFGTATYPIALNPSGGNVAINKSSANAALDVNGNIDLSGAGTDQRHIEIGVGRTGNGFSYVDLIGDTTYSDYGLRVIRGNTGANTSSELTHRGTGPLVITAFDAGSIQLRTANTERLRIDSSGRLGLGTSAPDTNLHVEGDQPVFRLTSTNALSTAAGTETIADIQWEAQYNNLYRVPAFIRARQDGTWSTVTAAIAPTAIEFYTQDSSSSDTTTSPRMVINNSGVVRPGADNTQTLGSGSYRWSVVYAGTGTINTSDEREKQQIANLDDAERRVAVAIKGLVKKYKYNDAVTLKGDDARIHVGVIAQEVIAAFATEGLDATRYALLCHDTWDAEPEETDEEGNVIKPARDAGERYGIRYDELLAFMIAAL